MSLDSSLLEIFDHSADGKIGGILVREFIHLANDPSITAGLVLLDSNHDDQIDLIDWRHPAIWAMADKLDVSTLRAFNEPHALEPSEWQAYQAEIVSAKHTAQAEKELAQYSGSFTAIKERGQLNRKEPLLGGTPVSQLIQGLIFITDIYRCLSWLDSRI